MSSTADLPTPGGPDTSSAAAAAVVGLVQAGADPVTGLAAADQPRAGLRRADGTAAGRQRREHRGAQLLRGRARRGAELTADGLVEALELPQRSALVALVRPPPGDGEVRLLVGGIGLQDLLPPTGQPQQLQVQQAQRLAGLLRPRLVEVVGQQRPAVQAERLGGPLGGPRSQGGLGLGAVPRGVDDDLGPGPERHDVVAEHHGRGAVGPERPTGEVSGLVQPRHGRLGRRVGPQEVDDLVAVQSSARAPAPAPSPAPTRAACSRRRRGRPPRRR